ncbi:MAG TPA: LamG domain-containing protein, partial [Sedimentisphaerales bacterium]|nr:LamG domain-containing protein [Sedimentisphaerales bacterium]
MCRKLVYLMSLAAVLIVAQSASAGLVGHWTFDEGSGTVAADSSGKGNNGTILGNATWVAGRIGSGALSFDASDDIVMVGDNPSLDIEDALTICLWVKAPDVVTPNHMVTKQPSGSAATNYPGNYEFRIKSNTIQFLHQTSQGTDYSLYQSASQITAGEWHHAAVSIVEGGLVELYLDGVSAGSVAQTGTFGILNDDSLRIGGRKDSKFFNGILDDVYIYDRALTPEQIAGLRDGILPAFVKAEKPSLQDGSMYENTWATLGWMPGDAAVSHNVYMGDNFEDVNAGTGDTFRGNVGTPSLLAGFPGFAYPGGLVPGTTYYWRIDEVNDANPDSPWKGDIWSFTIPPKTAYSPDPADGGKFVLANVTLSWTGGLGAMLHYVYFGDNFDDVNNATAGLLNTTTRYTPASPLELGKAYYWRVDEFDGAATHKGNVWSFTTIPVVPVAADPNLVVLWTLDEGLGTTAVDWSGHGHHGTVAGGAQWVDGYQGAALTFGDDVYVESAYPGISGTAA